MGTKSKHWLNHDDFQTNYNRGNFEDEFYTEQNENERLLILRKHGIKQILNEGFGRQHPSCLYFEGDLDGDGKNDYVISYGVKSSITILYLSSEANRNELIKAVSIFYSGYCC